jgi:hypothetical protein
MLCCTNHATKLDGLLFLANRQRDNQRVYPLEEGSLRASCGSIKRAYAIIEAIPGIDYSTPPEGFS